jgi:hypothetical protein
MFLGAFGNLATPGIFGQPELFCIDSEFRDASTLFYLTNITDWGRLSMFMDGRFLNVARVGFEIIMSEN